MVDPLCWIGILFRRLYELVVQECRGRGFTVGTGEFGAEMQVFSQNDGPVTILLDTEKL